MLLSVATSKNPFDERGKILPKTHITLCIGVYVMPTVTVSYHHIIILQTVMTMEA